MGNVAFILKARVTLLRDIGAALRPFNAFADSSSGWRRCRCGMQNATSASNAVAAHWRSSTRA